jgi:hypothetical protein
VKPELRRPFFLLSAVIAGILAVLLLYSQTAAFVWDDGFQMLAAQLIARGKRPYLDFCFPQTPLNAFWNAASMRIFGESWRVVHAVAATVTAGTALMAAHFIYARLPVTAWRLPGSIAVALLIGLDAAVIEYATLAQPYALCLFLLMAATRVAVLAVAQKGRRLTAAAGFLGSAAAASSLLVALAPVVLLVWILKRGRPGAGRFFLAGAIIPFLPVFWLFKRAPYTVFFNLFEYQLFYRRANWEDATPHDWQVLTSWLASPQSLTLGFLSVAGFWFIARRSGWDRACREEFYLCGWVALAVGAELCLAHPTFDWYFVLVIPFLAIPAAVGLYAVASRMRSAIRPWGFVVLLFVIVSLGCARTLFRDRNGFTWRRLEEVASKVNQVTPTGSAVWADESVYFLMRRPPVEGTAFSYAEIIDLPDRKAEALHIVSLSELDARAAKGAFGTVETCEEPAQIDELNLPRLFFHSVAVGRCHVFWEPILGASH